MNYEQTIRVFKGLRKIGPLTNYLLRLLIILPCIFIFVKSTPAQDSTRLELSKIIVEGNTVFSSTQLKDMINSQETPMWLWKFLHSFTPLGKAPEYYDSLIIESDERSLRDFYTANGFFNVLIEHSASIDSSRKDVILTYRISEGISAKVQNVKLIGLDNLSPEIRNEVETFLTFDSAKRFSQNTIKSGIDNTILLLENNGYMLIKYDSTIVLQDTARNTASLTIHFFGEKKYYISSLNIDIKGPGADKVEEEMLRDIVGIKKDDIYSYEKIRLSQVRLFRTGLFSSIIINPSLQDTLDGKVPMLLSGTIGPLNEFSPEIIINNQLNTFNVGFAGVITRKNFLGNARKLTLNGSVGISDIAHSNVFNFGKAFSLQDSTIFGFFEGVVRIEQPYVFNRPIFGTLDGYLKYNKDKVSNKRSLGGKISFEFELPRYTFVNYLNAYYNFEVVDETFPLTGAGLKLSESLSILGAELKVFKADDAIYPTSGYNLSFLFEEANIGNDILAKIIAHEFNGALFYRTVLTASGYLPTSSRNSFSLLAAKIKVGNIQNYKGKEIDIPSIKKFTVGGSNSVRGWKARELAPTEQSYQLNKPVTIVGGTFLLEGSFEYRHKFNPELGVVLFTDYGNTWLGASSFMPSEIAVASGLGLRYYTSFAPFRLDLAVKSYDPNNRKDFFKKSFFSELFEFQIGIGESF